jgi:regulatory protein
MATRRRRSAVGPDGPTPGSSAAAVPEADPVEVAKTIVLTQLSVAPRTRVQLEQVLARRGVPDDAASEALDRFAQLGYVDDEGFAQAWVESRHRGKGLARRALRYELRQRGVDDLTVDAAVGQLDPQTERETAAALVARKLPSTRGLPTPNRVNRLAGMLARKGYSAGVALAVVREALATEGEPAETSDSID